MRICQLAPLWKAVPPLKYGGSELIVSLLSEELARKGHEVTLIAAGGSETEGKLIEASPKPLFDLLGRFDFSAVQFFELLAIAKAMELAKEDKIDLVHNHMGFQAALFAPWFKVPVVTTLHSSLPPDSKPLAMQARDSMYISVSDAQRNNARYLNYIGTVHHGIEVEKFSFKSEPGNYLAYFATMRDEKGADRAIEIALAANLDLVMAGDIRDPKDMEKLQKYIDGNQIRYIGELNFAQKNELLGNALAYLFPIRWNEAFGLSVVESLACGTPVIAWQNGSMPEIIEDGENGYLVDSNQKALAAIERIGSISRKDCRESCLRRFDVKTMTENYLKIYSGLLR